MKSKWNEFNTFSKLIYPYLNEKLGYPERKSKYFDEQTWVRKRGSKKGPYDGAFKNRTGVILLVEAKKESHKLNSKDINQLFDYCLGDSFPVPPPYALLSNGVVHKWFKRLKNLEEDFCYAPCDSILWKEAVKQKGAGFLTEELTLAQTIKALKKMRLIIFEDLIDKYFPIGLSLKKSKLHNEKKKFEQIIHTRKSFVDASLDKAKEDKLIKSILSSVSLSITLKTLFIKILTDRKNDPFPEEFNLVVSELSSNFPGILKAEPYDALIVSEKCEELLTEIMSSVAITQALDFEGRANPIGDVWDGLVESEELDLQVKSLGNVYTPPEIVDAMVDIDRKESNGNALIEKSRGFTHIVDPL